jgi:hypothetical protein
VVAEWEAGNRGISSTDQFKLFGILRISPEQLFRAARLRIYVAWRRIATRTGAGMPASIPHGLEAMPPALHRGDVLVLDNLASKLRILLGLWRSRDVPVRGSLEERVTAAPPVPRAAWPLGIEVCWPWSLDTPAYPIYVTVGSHRV